VDNGGVYGIENEMNKRLFYFQGSENVLTQQGIK